MRISNFDNQKAVIQGGVKCEKSAVDRIWSLSKYSTYLQREINKILMAVLGLVYFVKFGCVIMEVSAISLHN